MQSINSDTDLRAAILRLEARQQKEGKMLKEQFDLAYESIKPINLIKNTFKEVVASGDLKDQILNSSVGLTAGLISKKIFERGTGNPIKKLIGTAIMFGVKRVVAQHPEVIKSLGTGLMNIIRNKSGASTNGVHKDESE
ncbi:MAG: hypothetical protein SH856_09485 [Flavobacteriales bacterium]|nr:hypothetical protein [Flavobacteriales bacterium]